MANRAGLAVGVFFALLTCATVPAAAQGEEGGGLSLDECLRTALANNLDLVIAKKNPSIAEQQIEVNHAPFDGVVGAGAAYNQNDGDNTITDNLSGLVSPPLPTSRKVPAADASFQHLLNFGATYQLTLGFQDSDSSSVGIVQATGALTATDGTTTATNLSLLYQMPLLQGFGKEVNTVNLQLARSGLNISREDLRLQAMQTLNNVEDAYWDVLAAREAVRIAGLALNRAQDLLELNRKKVEVGTLAPIEITQAEAGVASQEERVIVADVTLENAEDALLRLLAIPEGSPLWAESLELSDRPSFAPVDVDVDGAVAMALEHRPEIISARQRLRDSELSERVARKNTRHGLDLEAQVTPARVDDTFVFNSAFQSSDTGTETEVTDWRVGVRYRYPIRNRQAKANYAIARLDREQSVVSVQGAEQDIRVDVRVAARNVESGEQRIAAARKNVELQQKKLDAEQKKFENGMSTSFEVLTFQNDLADAELSEIRARLDYVKALAAFERAKGTLLEARGLRLDG